MKSASLKYFNWIRAYYGSQAEKIYVKNAALLGRVSIILQYISQSLHFGDSRRKSVVLLPQLFRKLFEPLQMRFLILHFLRPGFFVD